jgi:hypothetical protein
MVPITPALRDALIRVKKDPQLASFVDHLQAELAREQTAMMGLDAPMVYRAQGRASYVADLMKLIENADSVATSFLDKPVPHRVATAGRF